MQFALVIYYSVLFSLSQFDLVTIHFDLVSIQFDLV